MDTGLQPQITIEKLVGFFNKKPAINYDCEFTYQLTIC